MDALFTYPLWSMRFLYSPEVPPCAREGVKELRRGGGPGLQTGGKLFEIIVGRVTPRGVFQFFRSFRGTSEGGINSAGFLSSLHCYAVLFP